MTNPVFANPDGDKVFSPKVIKQVSRNRQEISQHSTRRVGLEVIGNGEHLDPETIKATLYQKTEFGPAVQDVYGLEKGPIDLDHEDVGVFSFYLDPEFTSELGHITIRWDYTVNGVNYQYWDYYQILGYMPTYEALTESERGVVRIVSNMFADLYDSQEGGPHLKEEFQTHFGSETIAQCMELAMGRINVKGQPFTHYNIGAGPGARFPVKYNYLLVQGTYLEVVRHLHRSYVEMPTLQGSAGVAMLDRSNYMDRWERVLKLEADDFDSAVRGFKRSLLNLGGGALLVSGGIYGTTGPWARGGMYAAQARAARFSYPATVVMTRPSGA